MIWKSQVVGKLCVCYNDGDDDDDTRVLIQSDLPISNVHWIEGQIETKTEHHTRAPYFTRLLDCGGCVCVY